jgi:hypothetical protein
VPDLSLGALSSDTAVKHDGEKYAAEVGLRWDNAGRPVGAILAGAMLRAASREAGMLTAVSMTVEFLNPARIGTAEITCEVVRRSSVLCCVNALATQGGRKVCQATTWLSAGNARQVYGAAPPDVQGWAAFPTTIERVGPGAVPFSEVLEQRPTTWIDDYASRPESTPYSVTWVRFLPGLPTLDLVTKACEILVAGDVNPPLTMMTASPKHVAAVAGAPTIALTAHFGSMEDDSEHLLIETSVECLSDAAFTGVVRVWTESMALRGQVTASYRLPKARP